MSDTQSSACARCGRPLSPDASLCDCGASASAVAQEAIKTGGTSLAEDFAVRLPGPNGLAVVAVSLCLVALPLVLAPRPLWHPNDEMQVFDYLGFRFGRYVGWLLTGSGTLVAIRGFVASPPGSRFFPLVVLVLALLASLVSVAWAFL